MEMGPALLQVIVALAATLALVFAAAWVFKRIGGGATSTSGVIRILAAAPLGTRERVLLVEVHGKQLLLGVTQQHVSTLHTFAEGTPAVVTGEDFKATLKNWMGRS
ncbi:MAG: flagellar biosynthetic protein FliO [Gammaproteobacteria bacterium]|nr:flagellar biosynthetic protein FliO [Gammaproteobacteria bacterium]